MPYYVGAGDPEWDEYLAQSETDRINEPVSLFKYVEPWQAETTVLRFAEAPGAEPEVPQKTVYRRPSTPKRGFFARLLGKQPAPVAETPQPSPEQVVENWKKRQKAVCARALWKLSGMVAACRAAGVKRVFGSYDGGGDESFTHVHGAEMRDGRVIEPDELRKAAQAVDYDRLVDNAVSALMGTFDAGEFVLRGAVIIDFDACTITDEKNADVVFGDKVVWRI
ncbi:MAG TPA: hypothetical protein VH684_31380 [Xanthobacteraceae bacterium]|jgi:hypothetical protein